MAAQVPDKILKDGEWKDLYSNPLESYWKIIGKKPPFFERQSCLRGYVAGWEMENRQLFLSYIEARYEAVHFLFWKKPASYSLKLLFPREARRGKVKATWFSGKLRIPLGKMTLYEHTGYDSRFEKEQIITVEQGNIIKEVTLDYTLREMVINILP